MERIVLSSPPGMTIEYEAKNEAEFGPCPDCGEMTKRVWGWVYRHDAAIAAYFVEWTPRHPQQDAMFDLIIGGWGEGSGPKDRKAISVGYRVVQTGPSFMVQDANARKVGSSPLVSEAMDRKDVIGHPIAECVFAICDAIYVGDSRIAALRP